MAAAIHSMENTPTWALATVSFVFISISIALEYSFCLLSNWLKRRRKHALCEAVEKLKSELMLLGFLSFLLAVSQSSISNICIPPKVADIMLPCRKKQTKLSNVTKLRAYNYNQHFESKIMHWQLADINEDHQVATFSDHCSSKGKVSFMTRKSMEQLQHFIFVIAVMQIVYSFLTLAFGKVKMSRWKAWEKETQTTEYQVAHDPERFRLTRQTTFARRHVSTCTETTVQLWIKCFFRQFFNPVAKVDYLTLRHGFITAHFSGRNRNFNFQEYIERSLDEDFKIVVSISPLMWFIAVIFMLVDVHGWHVFFGVSLIPLVVVLVLGTKLDVIVARMALQINNQNTIIRGTPLVQPNDEQFWFRRPQFVLTLLHYTLFMNVFELAFFIWTSIQFGLDSCYHKHTVTVTMRILLPITVQVLCSYITLPLYALVTQMGSQLKNPVQEDQMTKIIRQWHAAVRKRRKNQELQQSRPASLSTQCSTRTGTPAEISGLKSNRSIQLSNRGEITEEQDIIVKVEASSSHGPS